MNNFLEKIIDFAVDDVGFHLGLSGMELTNETTGERIAIHYKNVKQVCWLKDVPDNLQGIGDGDKATELRVLCGLIKIRRITTKDAILDDLSRFLKRPRTEADSDKVSDLLALLYIHGCIGFHVDAETAKRYGRKIGSIKTSESFKA